MKEKFQENIDWPEAEHRDLDVLLASVGHLAPREGLANAVMARVAIPVGAIAPQQARAVSYQWGRTLLAGYSVASAVSAAFLVNLVATGTLQLGTLSGAAQATWHALLVLAAGLATALPSPGALLELLPVLIGASALGWVTTMVSAVGLYRIMNSYSIQRIPGNAIR